MKNSDYIFACTFPLLITSCGPDLSKPNILWVTCEDITPMLGVYNDPAAKTPNLDSFAQHCIKFSHAFSTATVCSPSRSCIITGSYATSLGSQHLRSVVEKPEEIIPFPKYLKEAGYYTSNNYKEDYNFIDTTMWNDSSKKAHWRNRKKGQPFFSVFNFLETHQSAIFGNDSLYEARIKRFLPFIKRTSPDEVVLPSYYPDSPEIRKLWARYYTNVSVVDYRFGQVLKQLDEDGLKENTIVFFYSDHGTGMPRGKRAAYDSGLKIPLLVYIPDKYAAKFNFKPGTTSDVLVNFVDLAPTVLEIAGIKPPVQYTGRPFLSRNVIQPKEYAFGTSDRVDEAYEMSRTVRTKKYRYIRNFLPHLPLLQPNFYTDQSEIMQELEKFRLSKELTLAQQMLFADKRFPEELYDSENDPDEVNNLANDPVYSEILQFHRKMLLEAIFETFDTGFMPEPEMIRLARGSISFEAARNPELYPLKEIVNTCQLMLNTELSDEAILKSLEHPNGFVRYWGVVVAEQKVIKSKELLKKLNALLDDSFPTVQIEAAKTLVKSGDHGRPTGVIIKHMEGEDNPLRLFASRAFEEIAKQLPKIPEDVEKVFEKMKEDTNGGDMNSDYYKLYTYWSLLPVCKNFVK